MRVSAAKTERDRLEFIKERDGEQEMLRWAQQTLAIYVREAIDSSRFAPAIMELEAALCEHGREVNIVTVLDPELEEATRRKLVAEVERLTWCNESHAVSMDSLREERDGLRQTLANLLDAKRYGESYGMTAAYKRKLDAAWGAAREALARDPWTDECEG